MKLAGKSKPRPAFGRTASASLLLLIALAGSSMIKWSLAWAGRWLFVVDCWSGSLITRNFLAPEAVRKPSTLDALRSEFTL